MKIEITNHGSLLIWEGVYNFVLADYPDISGWELKKLLLFISYEKDHGRQTQIICHNKKILQKINKAVANPKSMDNQNITIPQKITECTSVNKTAV